MGWVVGSAAGLGAGVGSGWAVGVGAGSVAIQGEGWAARAARAVGSARA